MAGRKRLSVALLMAGLLLFSGCASKPGTSEAGVSEQQATVEASTLIDSEILPVGDSPVLGTINAPVTIVDFSSLQCPFCARGNAVLKRVLEKYPEEVRIVSKSFPLEFQPESMAAAKAALAAGEQGKYWEMRDILLANMQRFGGADMGVLTAELAGQLGLDVEQFVQDLGNPEYEAKILKDRELGALLGVKGTPHYFINGLRVSGAQPFQAFDAVINHILVQAEEMVEAGVSRDALYREMVKGYYEPPAEVAIDSSAVAPWVDPSELLIGKSYSKGAVDAPITIFEFSSFQCPFCAKGAEILDQVMAAYPGKIRLVYKGFPLGFQAEAEPATRAAFAAGRQGKFWEYYDLIYKGQRNLKEDGVFVAWAKELGLNVEEFEQDMNDPAIAAQVRSELAEGSKLGVGGTPVYFINGRRVVGAQPFERFKEIIDAELK